MPGNRHSYRAYIQQLYRIEKQIQHLDADARYQKRQQLAIPLLNEIRTWLDISLPQVPPISLTGKALHYLNNQWSKLIRYCEDGRLDIDNNATERAIRPFVIGRNNWICVSRRRIHDADVLKAA